MAVIAIMGGTLDPVHPGHIRAAKAALAALHPDAVLLLPDGDPPHKKCGASGADRLRMCELAVRGETGIRVSDMEVSRIGTTYTVDTLRALKAAHPEDRIWYIVGADTLSVMHTWRSFPEVTRLLEGVLCVPREGAEKAERPELPVVMLPMEPINVSSKEIRFRVARGMDTKGMLDDSVRAYIDEHALYRDGRIERLKATLKLTRFQHTLGVERTALRLAEKYGADTEKASRAALLHDCAKYCTEEQSYALIEMYRDIVPPPHTESAPVLHAVSGVAAAYGEYGERDAEVLSAIRWHTTGHEGMTLLEKIIYLADFIEPNRKPFPALESVRALAETDIDAAILAAAESTRKYVINNGETFSPLTEAMIRSIKGGSKP